MRKKNNSEIKKCHVYIERSVYADLTRLSIMTHRNRSFVVIRLIGMFFELPQTKRTIPVFLKACSEARYFDSDVISTLITFPVNFYNFLKGEFYEFLLRHSFSELINGICKKMVLYQNDLIKRFSLMKENDDRYWDYNYHSYLKVLKEEL